MKKSVCVFMHNISKAKEAKKNALYLSFSTSSGVTTHIYMHACKSCTPSPQPHKT